MPDQKISELAAITTIDNAADVLPIVDTSATTTKKVTPTQLKTSLALNNVDNTSDANKPISSATQTALDAKQATLVSGTNIKTINSTSLLGSGDITISASPSGVAGAIQFSNGSAFASDASNLFWDDTNKRLGVGTNAPTTALHVVGQTTFSDNALFSADFKYIGRDLNNSSIRFSSASSEIRANISTGGQFHVYNAGSGTSRFAVSSGGQTTISGGGSTSATTALLVQNSTGTAALSVKDDLSTNVKTLYIDNTIEGANSGRMNIISQYDLAIRPNAGGIAFAEGYGFNVNNSALIEMQSTTKGFLPPRMTTTQKNAIASPATGLVVYDSTTNKLCCYNGSTWNDLF